MQIKQATIYGFGKWVDDSIDFTAEPFVCVYGENESGKSTLQQFILFMLFGLPPKKRAFFQPKNSGKMGGRLTIFDSSSGEFTIERLDQIQNGAAKCYTPDGHSHDEDWLQERLGGMTHATYQSIFSFSSLDLVNISSMKEEELGEVLLGIGLTGSKNIQSIEKRLDTKIGDLFKPFGRKPEINQQLETLDELYSALNQYQRTEAAYQEKKLSGWRLSDSIEQLRTELQGVREELLLNKKKQQALPTIKAYQYEENLLANYPETIIFPENGLERLETLKAGLLPLESELSVFLDNQTKYKEKQASIRTNLQKDSVYENAEKIIQQKQNYLDNGKELSRLEESIKKLDMKINTEIDQLHIGITSDDLKSIKLPFHIENTWNQLKSDKNQLSFEKEHIQQEYRQLAKNRDYLIDKQTELNASVLDDSHISGLLQRISDYKQHEYEKKASRNSMEQLSKWKNVRARKEKNTNFWLIGSIVIAIILAIFSLTRDQTELLVISALLIAGGILQWIAGKRSFRDLEKLLQSEEVSSNKVTAEETLEAEQLLDANENKKKDLSSIRDQLRSVDISFLQWEEKDSVFLQKEERFNEQINTQYDLYPFLRQIDLNYWPEFLNTLKRLIDLDQEKSQYENQCHGLIEVKNKFIEWLDVFFQEMKCESANKSIEDQIGLVEQLLAEQRDGITKLEQYDNWIDDNADKLRALKQKMNVYEAEISELLSFAATETREEFLKQGKQLREKQQIKTKMTEMKEQLAKVLTRENYEELLQNKTIQESSLDTQYKLCAERIKLLEDDLDKKRQQLADINADLSNMESSETYSEVLHRFSMEQEQFKKLTKEWSIYKTAKELLVETKRDYRDKYLEGVIERTTHYFDVLTGGKYKSIFAPEGNKPFQVETDEGIRFQAQELSQGTINQLYVSLRLGISEVMSEKHRLPFIIDDAFVHFDSLRTKRVIEMLTNVDNKQQIILFTCKEEVVESAVKEKVINLRNSVSIN